MLAFAVMLAASTAGAATSQDQLAPLSAPQAVAMVAHAAPSITAPILAAGTPVRLMVLKEINSRTARLGDRFKLRVDEPIYINGAAVVPVGATAWGEIASVEKNGAVGKGGRLGTKLLYLDLPSGRVALRGEYADRGDGNGAGVVLAVVGFGILGLLTGGDSARLKAGDTFTGYVDVTPAPADAHLVVAPPVVPLPVSAAPAN
ncbi:MAG: hypothetical protein V4523_04945 [Pseudomonadota bacterium]